MHHPDRFGRCALQGLTLAGKAVLATDWSSEPRKTAINKDSSASQGLPLGAG
jgi:hypothetical protein